MENELKEKAEKEVDRVNQIMNGLKILKDTNGLKEVLDSYHEDCRRFFQKRQYLESLESAFICWAYVDAGLHLGVFEVSEELKGIFTV